MLETVKQKDAKAKHTMKKYGDQKLKSKRTNFVKGEYVLYKHNHD